MLYSGTMEHIQDITEEHIVYVNISRCVSFWQCIIADNFPSEIIK